MLFATVVLYYRAVINLPQRAATPPPPVKRIAKPIPPAPIPKAELPAPLPPAPKLKIQGLLYTLDNPTILIDGQSYVAGDTVHGVDIVEISRSSVRVRYAKSNHVYTLPW